MARQSDRAAATRDALLAAARDVFTTQGFTDANISDVVSRAGASVGSLYHHFGGKADLYLALFEDYQARQEERASRAVSAARTAGTTSPYELFLAGSRAYLEGCWDDRELARLFLTGGGPPGFELVARRRYRDWIRLNELLLARGDDPAEPATDVLVMVLTSVVSEAGAEVAVSDGAQRAARVIEDVLTVLARIAVPRPTA